jgi:hypothetical protein
MIRKTIKVLAFNVLTYFLFFYVCLFNANADLKFFTCDRSYLWIGDYDDFKSKIIDSLYKKNSDLLNIDEDGNLKLLLILRPEQGDKFSYKMTSKINITENSPSTYYKDHKITRVETFYFNHRVVETDALNNTTYAISFDSIVINTKTATVDSSFNNYYNTNIKNTSRDSDEYLFYNLISGEKFYAKVSLNGEINEISLSLGDIPDTILTNETLFKTFRNESEFLLSKQFFYTPYEVLTQGSVWERTEETEFLVFPVRKNTFYTLKGVKKINGEYVTLIREEASGEFPEKMIEETEFTVKLTASQFGSEGYIQLNVSKGCIEKIESKNNIFLSMNIYSLGGDGTSRQRVSEELLIERLD